MTRILKRLISSLLIACLAGLGLRFTQECCRPTREPRALARSDGPRTQRCPGGAPGARGKSADVKARVAAMTDDEVTQLAGRFDSLPAGGSTCSRSSLVVFIVLLITDLLGFTKIFPFTKPIR